MTGEIWTTLGINLLVLLVLMTAVAIPSFRTKDPSYIDGVWGLGFVALALSTLLQTDGDNAHRALLVGVTALWGLRLSIYLFLRWRRNGPDERYQKMLAKNEGSVPFFLLSRVFWTQAVLMTVVALPVQLGQVYDHDLTAVNIAGVVLALFGIAFEATADQQLQAFKADPANHGHVMDKGLWGYSRHPNYFGESCTWWGLFLVCVVNVPTAFAAIGPLLITVFLLRFSGVGPLEKQLKDSKPKYVDYIASTSGFVPLPKRNAAKVKQAAGV
jgi:steroid 5-alpha reductase family enzyme